MSVVDLIQLYLLLMGIAYTLKCAEQILDRMEERLKKRVNEHTERERERREK